MEKGHFEMPMSPATVVVRAPREVLYNLEKSQKVLQNVLTRLGCAPCTSGWDIRLVQENEFIVDASLNVRSLGGMER